MACRSNDEVGPLKINIKHKYTVGFRRSTEGFKRLDFGTASLLDFQNSWINIATGSQMRLQHGRHFEVPLEKGTGFLIELLGVVFKTFIVFIYRVISCVHALAILFVFLFVDLKVLFVLFHAS